MSTATTLGQNGRVILTLVEGDTADFSTTWTRFIDSDICVALSGTATDIVAVVERSPTDPGSSTGALPSPADDTGFSGDLSMGIAPNVYTEPGAGWWRVVLTTLTGGNCYASLSGGTGGGGA